MKVPEIAISPTGDNLNRISKVMRDNFKTLTQENFQNCDKIIIIPKNYHYQGNSDIV